MRNSIDADRQSEIDLFAWNSTIMMSVIDEQLVIKSYIDYIVGLIFTFRIS